jgi:hypothetical protein
MWRDIFAGAILASVLNIQQWTPKSCSSPTPACCYYSLGCNKPPWLVYFSNIIIIIIIISFAPFIIFPLISTNAG